VADEQLPDGSGMSKRERQKARRQQKLEQQAKAQKSEKAKKSVATLAVVALVVGALGVWGFSAYSERQERQERIAAAQERFADLGCTPIEEQDILPSQHLSGTELASNPPEVLYPDRPSTSGRHLGGVVMSGAFDKVIDERLLIHNLEHGYVHIYVDEDVDEGGWNEVADFVEGQVGGNTQKIIASRWKADLPDGANYAFTAWGARQLCEQWDQGIAEAFLADWHYLEGNAPERTIQPHLGGNRGGGQDPDEAEGDLLFPPLGEPADAEVDDAMEEPADNVEEGEDGPREDADLDTSDADADGAADAPDEE
jgi:hypothetical protein